MSAAGWGLARVARASQRDEWGIGRQQSPGLAASELRAGKGGSGAPRAVRVEDGERRAYLALGGEHRGSCRKKVPSPQRRLTTSGTQ